MSIGYEVREMLHGAGNEWRTVAVFGLAEDAQAFAAAHYETQTGGDGCECDECAAGWRVNDWKAYEVTVWGWG